MVASCCYFVVSGPPVPITARVRSTPRVSLPLFNVSIVRFMWSVESRCKPQNDTRPRYILSPLPRLVPVTGTFSLPFRDWCPLWRRHTSTKGWLRTTRDPLTACQKRTKRHCHVALASSLGRRTRGSCVTPLCPASKSCHYRTETSFRSGGGGRSAAPLYPPRN
eukprot:395719-Prorocentrum_minimum.AAC.1